MGKTDARSVHFRVSDGVYLRMQEEAEAMGVSVARFAREAAIARTVLWAHRRGYSWADAEEWEPVFELVDAMDDRDVKLRAEQARVRRGPGPKSAP